MLMTVRDYAAEKLASFRDSASKEAERRHYLHFATLNETAARAGARSEMKDYLTACKRAIAARDGAKAADLLLVCWSALKLVGPISTATDLAQDVRAISEGDARALAASAWVSGSACQFLGDMQRANGFLLESRLLARRVEHHSIEAFASCSLGEVATQQGELAQAREHFEDAGRIVAALDDRSDLRVRLLNSSAKLFQVSKPIPGGAEYARALDLARTLGDRRWEGGIMANAAGVKHQQGHRSAAVRLYEGALQMSIEMNDLRWAVNTECNLGFSITSSAIRAPVDIGSNTP